MAAGCSGFGHGEKAAIWDFPQLSFPTPEALKNESNSNSTNLREPIDFSTLPASQVADILESERSEWYQYAREIACLPGHPFRPIALEICEEPFCLIREVRANTFQYLSEYARDVRRGVEVAPVWHEIWALERNKRRALLVTVYILDYPRHLHYEIAKRAFDVTLEE